MTTQVERLTISLPRSLIALTDELASEKKTSRSKVVSACLQEFAQKRMLDLMEEGYRVMADEHREFARITAKAASEVVPPWD